MRVLHRHKHGFFEESLAIRKANNVGESNVRIGIYDLVLYRHCKLPKIWIIAEVWKRLKHPILKEFFYLFVWVFRRRLLFYQCALDSEIIHTTSVLLGSSSLHTIILTHILRCLPR